MGSAWQAAVPAPGDESRAERAACAVSDNILVKMPGLGLAVSVLIDATVVRLLLVPAVMTLLGRHAWWTPRWLARILPHIDAEGEHAQNLSARAGAKE